MLSYCIQLSCQSGCQIQYSVISCNLQCTFSYDCSVIAKVCICITEPKLHCMSKFVKGLVGTLVQYIQAITKVTSNLQYIHFCSDTLCQSSGVSIELYVFGPRNFEYRRQRDYITMIKIREPCFGASTGCIPGRSHQVL